MKKLRIICILTAALLLLCGCAGSAAPSPSPSAAASGDVVILFTNDVHCAVDTNIGYAGLAALRDKYAAEGCEVILADAGDAIQGAPIGTFSKGGYITDIMNEVGYDVAIPGNHEFDYGMDNFFELTKRAAFPYISANFTDLRTNGNVLETGIVIERGGIKIGFIGATTPSTLSSATPAYFKDANGSFIYGFCEDKTGEKLYSAVQSAADAIRAQGAEYVVLLSHLGIDAADSPWTSSELIERTSSIDAVLDAHSHVVMPSESVTNKDGQQTLLTSTGTAFANVGVLRIGDNGKPTAELITEYAEKDESVRKYVDDIQSRLAQELSVVVGQSDFELTVNDPQTGERIIRNAETNLGDFCADAYRDAADADVAFINGGGIRASIPAGEITLASLYTVQPFMNQLCALKATGQEILDALEVSCCEMPEENGSFLQVSGLSFEVNATIPSPVTLDEKGMLASIEGERRVKNALIGGKPLDPQGTYTVAGNDYILKYGGKGFSMFLGKELLLDCTMADIDLLTAYLAKQPNGRVGGQYAEPYGQERIVAADK